MNKLGVAFLNTQRSLSLRLISPSVLLKFVLRSFDIQQHNKNFTLYLVTLDPFIKIHPDLSIKVIKSTQKQLVQKQNLNLQIFPKFFCQNLKIPHKKKRKSSHKKY